MQAGPMLYLAVWSSWLEQRSAVLASGPWLWPSPWEEGEPPPLAESAAFSLGRLHQQSLWCVDGAEG